MNLTELLAQGPRPPAPLVQDRVLQTVAMLDPEQREAFIALIKDPQYTAVSIAKALTELGHRTGSGQVVYLRKKLREGKAELEFD